MWQLLNDNYIRKRKWFLFCSSLCIYVKIIEYKYLLCSYDKELFFWVSENMYNIILR